MFKRVFTSGLNSSGFSCHKTLIRHLMEIKFNPEEPLVDQKIQLKISGLKPHQNVTIKSSVTEAKARFSSSACFKSDGDGNVHADKQPSLLGTYTGIDPMGLFWSMIPDPGQKPGQRYMKRIVTTPEHINFAVFDGHHSWDDCHSLKMDPLVSKDLPRWFMHKTVKREEIRHGRLRGTLFIPAGTGPFPGVIDMFGTAGGQVEFRAALLASRGFISYALPYFNFEDLPKNFIETDFEYLKETVDWFSSHPLVIKNGIGISGVSKGGELALMLSIECPQVKSVVNINGNPFCTFGPIGPFRDVVDFDTSSLETTDKGVVMKKCFNSTFTQDKLLKTWETDVQILNIIGEDDKSVDPRFARLMYNKYPENKIHNFVIKSYPNAGHLIEPPYLPVCVSTFHKVFGFVFNYGGKIEDHARAQEDSWQAILQFFRTTLSANKSINELSSHL